MGAQNSTDKDNYSYSSWDSSLDDLICGEGKICGDTWTPISTRKNSFNRRSSEGYRRNKNTIIPPVRNSRSLSMVNYGNSLYSGHQVITQQPLPIKPELRSVALPESHHPQKRISSLHDYSESPFDSLPSLETMKEKKIYKKSTKNGKRTTIFRLGKAPPHQVKIGLANRRAHLDSRSEYIKKRKYATTLRRTHLSNQNTPSASQKFPSSTNDPINSWANSTVLLHRVIGPREKRGMEPPQPFRVKRVSHAQNSYISTYYL